MFLMYFEFFYISVTGRTNREIKKNNSLMVLFRKFIKLHCTNHRHLKQSM